jgi:chromosomal replication initiator protein
MSEFWRRCLERLEQELTPQQFNTWIRPLTASEEGSSLEVRAPNRFVLEWIRDKYGERINGLVNELSGGQLQEVVLVIGTATTQPPPMPISRPASAPEPARATGNERPPAGKGKFTRSVRSDFTFDNFVQGKSNQLARAASLQVAENSGKSYNPLFICGGVGLGKTHLMHAIGNHLIAQRPGARVAYLHSERFVAEMVKALQHNTINDFKR